MLPASAPVSRNCHAFSRASRWTVSAAWRLMRRSASGKSATVTACGSKWMPSIRKTGIGPPQVLLVQQALVEQRAVRGAHLDQPPVGVLLAWLGWQATVVHGQQ